MYIFTNYNVFGKISYSPSLRVNYLINSNVLDSYMLFWIYVCNWFPRKCSKCISCISWFELMFVIVCKVSQTDEFGIPYGWIAAYIGHFNNGRVVPLWYYSLCRCLIFYKHLLLWQLQLINRINVIVMSWR